MKCVAWTRSLLLALLALSLISCKTKPVTQLEYMPDMSRQASVRPEEADPKAPGGVGMRQPPAGTVPRGYAPYTIGLTDTLAANALANPLAATPDVLATGKKYFNVYCIVCHGARGDGLGYVVPKFTQPPILYSDKAMAWSDGRIFHTLTMGQGLMPSYASQIPVEQRWAIVKYVRALQRAAHPTAEDRLAARRSGVGLESDLPDTGKPVLWPAK
jgi:mono/diheme cytochrome c family protein